MRARPHSSAPIPARPAAALLTLCLVLAACGGAAAPGARTPPPDAGAAGGLLAPGRGAAPISARIAGGMRLARRVALAWAAAVYRRRPPRMPGETAAARRALAAAATRVPPARRGLHARLLGLRLHPLGPRRIRASARLGDGRFPPFSVGFTVAGRGGRWYVTAISPPD